MSKQSPRIEISPSKDRRPRSGPLAWAKLPVASNDADKLPEQLGRKGIGDQVALLSHSRLQTAQRQAMAAQIGRIQGNRYLQRRVASKSKAMYKQKLKKAISLLNGVQFGRAAGRNVGRDVGDKYDTTFWSEQPDPSGDTMLVLRSGKLPSDAIDAMFAHLGKWRVDCAEFIQVAQWYALRHTLGADKFNKKVRGLSFRLKPHGSTGIETREMFYRHSPGDKMKRLLDGKLEPKSINQLLTGAPIGSRTMWTNFKAPTSSAFRNENAIKLGPNLFAAHGFGGSKNTFTRPEIERNLARAEDPSAGSAYIAANIFIAEIEHYKTP